MALALIVIGLVLVVTGAQDTHVQLARQLRSDMTGPNNFLMWVLALILIGAVGYVKTLRPLSVAFMTLVVIGILIANPNFFDELSSALKDGPISPQKVEASQGGFLEPSKEVVPVDPTERSPDENRDELMKFFGKILPFIL